MIERILVRLTDCDVRMRRAYRLHNTRLLIYCSAVERTRSFVGCRSFLVCNLCICILMKYSDYTNLTGPKPLAATKQLLMAEM